MMTWVDCRREPFRILFPLGVLFGLAGTGHWLAYATGRADAYSGVYHASVQMAAYMVCFVAGFLMTALPRFASAAPAAGAELLAVLGLLGAQAVLLTLGRWVAAQACFAGILLVLAVFAGRRFARRRAGQPSAGPPTEFVWIGVALAHGLIGAALVSLDRLGRLPAWALAAGRPMLQQGFLLSIVLGVGGFMAPRLLGRPALLVTPAGMTPAQAARLRVRRAAIHGVAGAALFGSFLLEGAGAVRLAYGLRAMIVTAELLWTTRFHRPPAVPDGYVRLLWVALWMIVVGYWGVAAHVRYRVASLHLVFLGGFSLMTFAVATMVVLSHAGEGRRLSRPLWIIRVIGAGLLLALAARVLAELWPGAYFQLLGIASACWMAVGIAWLVFALPRVLRALPPGAFDELHNAAKRRILHTTPSG